MSEPLAEKIMPQSTDAEQALLAAIFLNKDAIYEAMQILVPEDFYRQDHAIIYAGMLKLNEQNKPIDLITLSERLQQEGNLEKIGGITVIAQVMGANTITTNAGYYAQIIKEKSILRNLIRTGSNIANRGYENAEDADSLLDDAEKMILSISQNQNKSGLVSIDTILSDAIDKLEFLYNQKEGLTGVPSGFVDLDNITHGWQPSDFIILAARPSMGKTAFCLNLAQNAAIQAQKTVAVFSLEMSSEQLIRRMISSEAEINQDALSTGRIREEDWSVLIEAITPLAQAPIYIDDTPALSIRQMRAKCRRLKAEKGLDLIIVDYLQLMTSGSKTENRQQEVSQISRSLKALARELEVPVIALSQLSRSTELSGDKKPSLSHLRESGSLEQDADIVMFIHREEYYNRESEKKGIASIIIAKHRNGAVGEIELSFRSEFIKFGNLYHG